MSQEVPLTLHTIPSTWTHRRRPPTAEPYQRVVGVESAAGTVACRFALETPSEPSTFTVPEVFAARLTKFFERHIASHDPEDPRSPEHPEQSPPDLQGPRMRYNCHLFALAMLGVHPVTPEGVERLLVELARSYKP